MDQKQYYHHDSLISKKNFLYMDTGNNCLNIGLYFISFGVEWTGSVKDFSIRIEHISYEIIYINLPFAIALQIILY